MYRCFQIFGVISLVASLVLLVLFAMSQSEVTRDFVLPAWAVTTLVGILCSGLGLLALVIHWLTFSTENNPAPKWRSRAMVHGVILLVACLGFVPLDVGVVRLVLALEKIHNVRVVNLSPEIAESVRLEGGYDYEFGPLEPSAEQRHSFRVQREGDLRVVTEQDGERSEVALDDWVHPEKGAGRDWTIYVQPDGTLTAEEAP